jgi:hypothetical protein
MAHMQYRDARDYSVIRDRIAKDFYRAAGAHEKAVPPTLGREQIAELNKYADTLPFFSTDRKEFKEAARMAEESLQSREGAKAARGEAEQPRSPEASEWTREQSRFQVNAQRSEQNGYTRGR